MGAAVKPGEYLEHVRTLVNGGDYRAAVAFATREAENLRGRLSRKQLGSLSILMEHANLAAARENDPSPGCESGVPVDAQPHASVVAHQRGNDQSR